MQDLVQMNWRGVSAVTSAPAANGTPGALPDTTPDKPYLSDFTARDGTKITVRSSAGATIDYKRSRNDRVSFSFQYALFDAEFNNRSLAFVISRVLSGNNTRAISRCKSTRRPAPPTGRSIATPNSRVASNSPSTPR